MPTTSGLVAQTSDQTCMARGNDLRAALNRMAEETGQLLRVVRGQYADPSDTSLQRLGASFQFGQHAAADRGLLHHGSNRFHVEPANDGTFGILHADRKSTRLNSSH